MIYKLHKNGSFNIHTIKTDRFKSLKMEIVFRNNLNKDNVAKRTLLFELLTENSLNYKTKRDLILKEEELYNAYVYSVTSKLGSMVLSSMCIDFLNPKFTEDNYLEEAIKLPFELIFKPNAKEGEFDPDTLNVIKKRMEAEIKTSFENAKTYALERALKNMDEESLTSVNIMGTLNDLEAITPTNLYEEYNNILNHDYVDVFIIGDFDEDKVIDLINKYAAFKTIKNHELNLFIDNKTRSKVKERTEKKDNYQTQLVYIYNTTNLTPYERKYSMQIFNMILGGGSLETKLYQNLRDKNSLCYNVQSIYNKYDNILIIFTSIDKDNISKAKKLIESSVKEMHKNISEEELSRAISSCISSINLSLDDEGRIIDNYLFNYMAELDPIDTRLEEYKKVSLKDLKGLSSKIKLNSIYILEGENHGED